ncbi:MAG: hypothetical protein ACYCS7_15180 [Acidimicrobiales bacterium]
MDGNMTLVVSKAPPYAIAVGSVGNRLEPPEPRRHAFVASTGDIFVPTTSGTGVERIVVHVAGIDALRVNPWP